MSRLVDIAPRIGKARDQLRLIQRARSTHELWVAGRRLEIARVIAHRELQLVRAYNTRNARYIKRRQDKLEEAHRRYDRLEAVAHPSDVELLETAA